MEDIFFLNVYIARNSTVDVYGNYLLVVSILTIASLVSMMGLDSALSKLVPEYSVSGASPLLKGVVVFGFFVVFLVSVFVAVFLYLSGVVSVADHVLLFFPALVLSFYLQSVFRAFKEVALSRFFDQILRPSVFVVLLFLYSLFYDGVLELSHVITFFSASVLVSLLLSFWAVKLPNKSNNKQILL